MFLDANENPYNQPYNRYPDPLQEELKAKLSVIKRVPTECIFLGNGSDEAIDLVYRVFCRPQIDNVVAIEPTYGMYKVCADINDVEYRPVLLDSKYEMNADALLQRCDRRTKVIWFCTPNNPTGNNLSAAEIEKVLTRFPGMVVIDEAYSDFSTARVFRTRLKEFDNMIVLNTMSKAWGCAAIRLGMAFAQKAVIDLFNKVKYPYNVNSLTQAAGEAAIRDEAYFRGVTQKVLATRADTAQKLRARGFTVLDSATNFLFARPGSLPARTIYEALRAQGVFIRYFDAPRIRDWLRITIGTPQQMQRFFAALDAVL